MYFLQHLIWCYIINGQKLWEGTTLFVGICLFFRFLGFVSFASRDESKNDLICFSAKDSKIWLISEVLCKYVVNKKVRDLKRLLPAAYPVCGVSVLGGGGTVT